MPLVFTLQTPIKKSLVNQRDCISHRPYFCFVWRLIYLHYFDSLPLLMDEKIPVILRTTIPVID